MLTYELAVFFGKGYIGHPYWAEKNRLVDIQKESGMNRARSGANRRKALEEYLRGIGMTLADYERLEQLADRPWVTDEHGEILVPERHIEGFLVATCDQLRAATRPCDPEQVRGRLKVTPWRTGRNVGDGKYERFAVVTSGTGSKLSNQRGYRSNDYIENVDATGEISFDPDFVDPKTLKKALEWGGTFVGIGACRKMGYGRFELRKFEAVKVLLKAAV